jgi:FKBP-type peptidyl-prolyl cis-trans isomerase
MTIRPYFAVIGAAFLLSGCMESLTDVQCVPVPLAVAEVRGDTVFTTTGLAYIEGEDGSGVALDWCHMTAVHYTGYLVDGSQFDTTRDHGQPLVFTPGLGVLIDGFEQGVIGLRAGGTRRLIIPPGLGFGSEPRRDANGQVVVPGNSTLVYDIEVVQIAL